jgi:hypothetical protein
VHRGSDTGSSRRIWIRCASTCEPLEASGVKPSCTRCEHVSGRLLAAALSSASPSAFASYLHLHRAAEPVARLPGTADISPPAPRSATSPTQDRGPRTAATTAWPPVAHACQRLKSNRPLLSLRRLLPVDVCSFPSATRLSHGNEEHLGALQPPAMESQWTRRRPVCSSSCCTDGKPYS